MKVNGFTTLELSVAMVLAALVTGIGYTGYTLFLKQLHGYNKNLDEAMDFRNLQTLLYKDFYISRHIEKQEGALHVYYENMLVTYYLDERFIIREQEQLTDTFKFPVHNVRLEFNGAEQFLPGGKVDVFELELEFKKQRVLLSYYKEYSRGELMEWDKENEY